MSTATEQETTGSGLGRERLIILGGLMLGMLLGSIDQSIVSTALPTIVGDLGGAAKLSWIVTAYLITVTVTTPIYGKLSDLYGRSIIYEISITIFLIGSALSGLSGDIPLLGQYISPMTQLTLFRALQGVGAGGLIAMATTILGDIFSPRERGRYMSYMMLIFGAATIGGPLLGGWLTDTYTWRWIFYINIPIGLAAIAVTHFKLDLPVPDTSHTVDYLGAGLLVVAVTALVLVTTWGGNTYAWTSTQILTLGAATVVFAALFVYREIRVDEPIFPVHLLSLKTVAGVDILSFCLGAGMFGATIYLPVFLQSVLGASATNSGLLLLPLVGGMLVTSGLTGQLMTRFGQYKVFTVLGAFLGTVGFWLLHTMGPQTTSLESTAYMIVTGLGLGFVMPTLTVAVQNAVDRENLGVATTSVTFTRSLGSSIGVAVLGALLTSGLANRLADAFPSSSGAASQVTQSGGSISPDAIASLPPQVQSVVQIALANSIDTVFLASTIVLGVGLIVAVALPRVELSEEAPVEMAETPITEPDEDVPTHESDVSEGHAAADWYDDIVVPTDGSDVSTNAITEALRLAELSEGTLHAIFVFDPTAVQGGPLEGVTIDTGLDEILDAFEAAGEQAIAELRRAAGTEGVDVTGEVREGDPSDQIVGYSEEVDGDVIVMGTHGRSGVRRALLGNTAEGVIHKSNVPVLAVRTQR